MADEQNDHDRLPTKVLQPMDSLEDNVASGSGIVNDCFTEDYSVREGTLIDKEIASDENFHHPVVDEFFALNNEWAKGQPEDTEKILERLELEALIKRAEDKLLPEESNESTQVLIKPDKLNRMESSDFSEEEGFQLRLSCIFEESESDASGSATSKIANKILIPLSPTEESSSPIEIPDVTETVNVLENFEEIGGDIVEIPDENNVLGNFEETGVEESDVRDIAESLELDRVEAVTESADVESDGKKTEEKKMSFKRGRSAEPRHCVSRADFADTVSISSEKNVQPKWKTSKRGRSLESGLAEKSGKIEKNPETEEERPPVPPETYLWEELRRWRIKGGYPWTHLDKPPYDEKTWKTQTDHEYEPINPPPMEQQPSVESTDTPEPKNLEQGHILGLLKIPNDDQLVISAEDMEVEAIEAAREFQSDVEDRFLATSMTGTTASRTDCDVNTSMLDSSGLEDLPLKRDSRSKKAMQLKTEQMRLQAQGLQQRIRMQAGKLRNKLRNLPRPSFQRKQEREKKPETEEKSRFRLPDKSKFILPERPRFKMPQKPKINLPGFSKPLRERNEEPKKNIFDIDFKTYPRMFNKKSKDRGDYATSSPKQARSATPPPRPIQPARKKGPVGQRWVNRFDDIRFVDDRASGPSHRSDRSESLSDFHDKDFGIGDDDLENNQLPPPRALSTKSSASHVSEFQSSISSEDPHRQGVIEEIDSDQFFLRQKGISQENVDMGNYLSQEIREAFRAPVVNALQQLDLDYEPSIEHLKKIDEPEPQVPVRTRSLKRMKKVNSQEQAVENEGKVAAARYENLGEENDSEYYKTPPPPEEYLHYKIPRRTGKRKYSEEQKSNREWVQVDIETSLEPTTSGHEVTKTEDHEPEYIIPETQPDVPKRTRSLSRGPRPSRAATTDRETKKEDPKTPIAPKRSSSKSLHSLNLKNDRFRRDPDCYSVQSLKLTESSTMRPTKKGSYSSFTEESQTLPKARSRRFQSLSTGVNSWGPKAPQRTRSRSSVSSKTKELEDYAGYAVVEKVKPARPPPPRRRKHSPEFNTFPRNQPARPVRNYATLGPSRPPRRCKQEQARSIRTQSLEHIYTEDIHPVNGIDLFLVQDLHGSNKDLQATDVVEKMKGRPLPAPPRPPRIKAKSEENTSVEVVEEVCVSTQTDPLPDDLCLEDDVIQEFSHEQMKLQQEFLREMREEEERIHKEMEAKRAKYIERDQAMRDDRQDDTRQLPQDDEVKKTMQQIVMHEDDLGYASLDRRQTVADEIDEPCTSRSFLEATTSVQPRDSRLATNVSIAPTEPQQPVYVPLIPSVLTTETLRVGSLEVDQLRVNHLETNTLTVADLNARQISVQDVRGTNLAIDDLRSNSGQLSLENIQIPPEIIQQIIARIPWEELVSSRNIQQPQTTQTDVREDSVPVQLPSVSSPTRRRHRVPKHPSRSQASSDEDSVIKRQVSPRRSHRAVAVVEQRIEPSIANLGRQLAIACTDASLGAVRQLINNVRQADIPEDRARYLQAMFCFALVAIAGYVLLCLHGRDVHHHHWDFQFPPQPPRQ